MIVDKELFVLILNSIWIAIIIYLFCFFVSLIYLRHRVMKEFNARMTQINLDIESLRRQAEELQGMADDFKIISIMSEILKDGERIEQTERRNDDSERWGTVHSIHPEGTPLTKSNV